MKKLLLLTALICIASCQSKNEESLKGLDSSQTIITPKEPTEEPQTPTVPEEPVEPEELQTPPEPEEPVTYSPGILPYSIDDVVDVFEIKYGEVKEWRYNDQVFKFSVADIEDHLMDCSVVEFLTPEDYNRVRLHVLIRTETDKETSILKISTAPCFAYFYRNDESNIKHVWNMLESWQSSWFDQENNSSYFKQSFGRNFGEGTAFEDCSIHIAKVHPFREEYNYNVEKSMYKFIFIITDSNKTRK